MWVIIYIGLIVVLNVAFSVLPMIETPFGLIPPATFLVGFVFVVRDFAQREIGHWVLLAMIAAAAISYVMADPYVALASLAAFAVSELIDWTVYTFSPGSFRRRVFMSSIIGCPVDSLIFLGIIGAASLPAIAMMTAVKWLGVLFLFYFLTERRAAIA